MKRLSLRSEILAVVCAASTVFGPSLIGRTSSHAADWPNWRGPTQNGISTEVGLIEAFDPKGGPGSNVLWKSELAAGISTPIVMNGRLFTIVRDQPGTRKDAEQVIALDADSGELLWENVYNVFLSDLPAERVGWSHVCGDPELDRVYALGACCFLQCMDAATGKTVWSRSMSEEFGMLSTYGGRTNTPVVFENLVIISGVTTGWDENARPAHRFFAFDKQDGTLVWSVSTRPLPEDTTYSTPVVKVIGDQAVMVAGSGDGDVYGIQPRTGKILWRQAISRRGINTSVAVDSEGNVFATHGEENPAGTAMGAVVRIDARHASLESASAEAWRTEEIMSGKSSPLLVGERLYVVEDSSRLRILDRQSGEEVGEPMKLGTSMRGSLLYADGKIFACTAQGVFHVLRPTQNGVESLFKIRLPRGHEAGGSPIAAEGRIYLPTTGGLFCLKNETVTRWQGNQEEAVNSTISGSDLLPMEDDPAEDPAPAQLQLVPAEAIVQPGQSLPFNVAIFNSLGQQLKLSEEALSFDVQGAGTIDRDGLFVADSELLHRSAVVRVRMGELTATAKLRIVPALPWAFDFSDGDVPITWIGARYRHEGRQADGNGVIAKVSTIPKGTRSQAWFGPADLHDYTITADVKAQPGNKLPDMGVIAQRYTLDLMGESQQLQIRTWAAQLRMAQSVPVTWKAGVWYTLKFQATTEGDQAVLRGKVWPRDEVEPSEWTVTATDEAPNRSGSPGLFGNATNAEFLIDNVTVQAN
ncbi:PQQ-like beta-propeller repeat protein [Rhodopirellula sp. JC740]|uniref:PQQ-like beta-propeller repeat protein n=1 Tax=Rhodopirellula halodulae TaxID=2894198 RepID=A0ABS8NFG2_9BACT|nr:PQQ-like beta-propeller repeat protein [Rhodopirellula sp. JC740]